MYRTVLSVLIVCLALTACGGETTPTPDAVATQVAALKAAAATLTAEAPTNTATSYPIPTPTITPSPTRSPTATCTASPTRTLQPTHTPTPTVTPMPQTVWAVYESEEGGFRISYTTDAVLEPDDSADEPMIDISGPQYRMRLGRLLDSPLCLADNLKSPCESVSDQETIRALAELWAKDIGKATFAGQSTVAFTGVWEDAPLDTTASWRIDMEGQDDSYLTVIIVQTWYATYVIVAWPDSRAAIVDTGRLIESFEATGPPSPPAFAISERNAVNIRLGPGTNHPVLTQLSPYSPAEIVGRNDGASWWQVCCFEGKKGWVSASVTTAHGKLDEVQVAGDIPTPPPSTPAPTLAKPTVASESIVQIGDEIEGGGWRFKVTEIHKRKAVYFYGRPFVAQGHFLVVIIEAVNLQSGTDYFAHNLKPWITEAKAPTTYLPSSTGSTYAQWQYEGLSGIFTYVNPGNFSRIAVAFDLPDNLEEIRLSTDIPRWVDLGNFSAMPSEDN